MKRVLLIATVCISWLGGLSFGSDQIPAPPQDHPIALTGGTIHTISGPVIEGGTILFDKGVIVAVGKELELPPGTETIDISGLHVYPGLIALNSLLGLTEIGAVAATQDYRETGDLNPNLRAERALNPDSELLPVARWNGITMAEIAPRGGLISGQSAVIVLDGWTWEDMTLRTPAGLHIQWPPPSSRGPRFGTTGSEDSERRAREQVERIRSMFAAARAYAKAKQAEAEKGIPYHETDVRLEALLPYVRGELPVFIHANDLEAIEQAITWGKSEGLKIVLVGGNDAWRIPELLKENDVPVVVTGTHRLPARRWEPYDAAFSLPARLYEAGVRFCIAGTGNASLEGNLPYHAATAVAYGLPHDEALKAITLYPAQILGIDDRVGSLEKGKDATLIVTTGDPLEVTTNVKMEFIQGRRIDLSSKHTQLYAKYRTKYERLGRWGKE